uniref:Sodium/calcium exchanger membrane region domain-containing protein n=1 Tax=Salarias fasciatus TaxID=181472 RepID=A0A672FS60_SALFA
MASSSDSVPPQCQRSNLISLITRDRLLIHAVCCSQCFVLTGLSDFVNCDVLYPAAIHEFPDDVFSKEQRKHGAVLLHVLCAIYMFYALAIVCDDYFVPSLEKISENLQLSEDVAGATFMAAGSSAPELFTSLIGVFITKGDVGVGTIVGSAVFNILVIIGLSGIFAGQTVVLTWWSLFRDSSYYILSVLTLIMVRRAFRQLSLRCGVQQLHDAPQQRQGELPVRTVCLRRPQDCRYFRCASLFNSAGQAPGSEAAPVVMVDELLILNPHKLSFSEAGLRIMITPHFSPRTRLSMAGRMLISEVHATPLRFGSAVCFLLPPDGRCARVKWLITWPLGVLLYCTVPNCILPRWHRWFMVTFVASTLWIAVFSYLMVWMVTIISFTLDIPDYIMGITFLAAGTSVPDCMASLIVARQGMGDMAVSNSIGSNIFDILLGLGFPWALRTLVVDHGSTVSINNKGLVYSVVLLLASVFLTVMSVHLNHWRLDRRLGLGLMFLYAIFLLCSILFGHM